jgi:hypothetical protein
VRRSATMKRIQAGLTITFEPVVNPRATLCDGSPSGALNDALPDVDGLRAVAERGSSPAPLLQGMTCGNSVCVR